MFLKTGGVMILKKRLSRGVMFLENHILAREAQPRCADARNGAVGAAEPDGAPKEGYDAWGLYSSYRVAWCSAASGWVS